MVMTTLSVDPFPPDFMLSGPPKSRAGLGPCLSSRTNAEKYLTSQNSFPTMAIKFIPLPSSRAQNWLQRWASRPLYASRSIQACGCAWNPGLRRRHSLEVALTSLNTSVVAVDSEAYATTIYALEESSNYFITFLNLKHLLPLYRIKF